MSARVVTTFTAVAAACLAAGCARSPRAVDGPRPAPARTDTTPSMPTASLALPAFDRGARPALGAAPSVTLPPVTERTLSNGLRVLIVEHRELPIADLMLVVGTGAEGDPAAKAGLATLTASVLDEGTTTRNALQIADQAAFLGVRVGASAGWDASTVSLHTPTAQLDSAFALFADIALRPSFPAADFQRLRQERLTSLIQLRDRPTAIADRAYNEIVFGSEHPYGRPLIGTEASTRAITRADVRRFYDTYYRPNNATLIVVGDVAPDDVVRRVEQAMGSWARGTVPVVAFGATPARQPTAVTLIDKPGAPQTSVRIGLPGVARSTSDYFPLLVMNTVLGGSFTSRLNQNLRETKGYTYGARSGFSMRRAAGPFVASAEVTGTKTDSSLIEFMKELRAIRESVPAAELEKAKQYLQLQFPGDFESTGDIAGQLVPLVLYGLPLDYYNSYVQRVGAVTQADVQRVARAHLDPANFTVVIVGDRASIEPGVRALNLGPVTVRPVSGAAVRVAK
jgi:zinc protease